MTREEAKEFYPILQAYAEGRVIECRTKPSTMKGADTPNDWTEIKKIAFWNNTEYRIKPESKYRPFESAQECIEEMRKHEPFGWVKNRPNAGYNYWSISGIRCDGVVDFINLGEDWCSAKAIFAYYTFLDGSPFGVKVEDKEE